MVKLSWLEGLVIDVVVAVAMFFLVKYSLTFNTWVGYAVWIILFLVGSNIVTKAIRGKDIEKESPRKK